VSDLDPIEPPSPALASILEDVRRDAPEVDWAKVEARLFDARGDVVAPRAKPTSRRAIVASSLAIAAAFAIALAAPVRKFVGNEGAATAQAPVRPGLTLEASEGGRSGRAVAVGERIVGDGSYLRAAGRISIRVEPGAIVRVLDDRERIRLALDEGAVTADVVPVPGGEPFAVDVLGRRVAVHGTRLRVAITAGAVEVAVSEGSAVVGPPRGEGRTEGSVVAAGALARFEGDRETLLHDPARARELVDTAFVAHTAKGVAPAPAADPGPRVDPSSGASDDTSSGASDDPGAPKTAKAIAKPVIASANAAEPSVAAVVEPARGLSAAALAGPLAGLSPALASCAPKSAAGVSLTIETTLILRIEPNGKVSDVSADPGLDAPVRDCVRARLSTIDFPTATAATSVRHPIVLGNR
jgi:hypothetical protein